MTLSIIVPCHNEEKNVPLIVERFRVLHREEPFELIVVNNASQDGTGAALENFRHKPEYSFLRVVDEPTPGYGRAIMTGLKVAGGDILAWTHADLQTDPSDVLTAYRKYRDSSGKRVVKGRRIKRGGIDEVFTFVMGVLASVVLRLPLWDVNAQPKVFDREFFGLLTNPPDDFSLDLYWLWLAKKHGYTVLTIPVDFGQRQHGESKSAPNLKGKLKTSGQTMRYIFTLFRGGGIK